MALYLVRHGETDYNREKRFQSRIDVPLNATGLMQAKAVRNEFARRGVQFDLARCSPLSRAVHTARIILEDTPVDLVIEPLFIELDFGGFDGKLESELREEYGARFDAWRESQYTTTSPAGGEDIISGAVRVQPALDKLLLPATQGNVLVVAHQAVNMAMKVAISGKQDVKSAATFRQQNHEVDVWDMAAGARVEQFAVKLG
jgi:probable phosphoglycerate mutase